MQQYDAGVVAATLSVATAYVVAAWARSSVEGKWSWNFLVITRGAHARASLSKLQLFFFTMVVLWVVVAVLVWTRQLAGLSGDVVVLLGIGAAGTAGGKITAVAKNRLDYDNWAWLVRKKWIKESLEPGSNKRQPVFSDLLCSRGEFDISKFQLFVFSLVTGAALIFFAVSSGNTASLEQFEIPGEYLALIGLSQAAYIGGKAVNPGKKADLDRTLNEVRTLERDFVTAVEKSWSKTDLRGDGNLAAARSVAPEEYHAYRLRAQEAAMMVSACTGNPVSDTNIEPAIPR